MTRSLLILGIGVAVFALGLLALVQVRAHSEGVQTRVTVAHPGHHNSAAPKRASHGVLITVKGLNFTFAPSTVTVPRDTTIIWVNRTASPHTVTSVTPGLFDVSVRGHGMGHLTLHRAGTYLYYCALHPYMLGVIVVRPSGALRRRS